MKTTIQVYLGNKFVKFFAHTLYITYQYGRKPLILGIDEF